MMNREVNWLAIGASLALAACGGDGSTDPTNGGNGGGNGGGAAAVAEVSGSGQTGKTLEALGNPFVVLVTDAEGAAVSGATVSWAVVEGTGSLSSASSTTNVQGRASVTFTPGATLGSSTVRATVSGVSQGVDFTVETTVIVVRMQNTAFVAPQGGDDITVPLGTVVEWVNLDAVQHTATSSATPAGGEAFDTGLMGNGERRQFTPGVEGTWTYLCEVHPGIMVNAMITVVSGSAGSSGDQPGDSNNPGNPDDPYDPTN